ncbi:MAG: sigma-70 family RNA polymerase sigma factor [Sedimentisphaerales bacterium]|nr:sigma-70 family RNA polymerase sigma factor [Sedimentisphaerales bacterium]
MEDKLLVLRCQRGSREALARIYAKYKTDLLVLAMALLNDAGIAEDVVHDVILSFARGIERFRPTGSLRSYLLTCTANRARNVNKAKHRQGVEFDPAVSEDSHLDEPSKLMICNEQLKQLSDALAQLPYDQREVIMLHFQAAMTFKTIAKSLAISVNTAKSRYRYGIEKLRNLFENEVNNETGRKNQRAD